MELSIKKFILFIRLIWVEQLLIILISCYIFFLYFIPSNLTQIKLLLMNQLVLKELIWGIDIFIQLKIHLWVFIRI